MKAQYEQNIKNLINSGKEEIFKDVKGFEGKYQISNFGRVWSLKVKKFLGVWESKGNLNVSFWKEDGKASNKSLKKLVADNFIGKKDEGYVIEHIDGNKANCSLENLNFSAKELNKESVEASEESKKIINKLIESGKEEIWKDIKGFEGRYQISNFGRVWSLKAEKIKRPYYFKEVNYFAVSLPGSNKVNFIHHLVANHFLPEDQKDEIIDHIDQNKLNNSVWNLRYVSRKENAKNVDRSKNVDSKPLLRKFEENIEELEKSSKVEIWKEVPGSDGNYQISNFGRLKSIRYNRIVKPGAQKSGYFSYSLKINGKKKSEYVHRLVAKIFIINKENAAQVDHINENKADNSIWNLKWVSRSENCKKRGCSK